MRSWFQRLGRSSKEFVAIILFCLQISWQASKQFTLIRFVGELVSPLLTLAVTWVGRNLINNIAQAEPEADSERQLVVLFSLLLLLILLRHLLRKLQQFALTLHAEQLQNSITVEQMRTAFTMDLTYFDQTESYDKLVAIVRDGKASVQILWNVLSFISTSVSLLLIITIIAQLNPFYALAIVSFSIPALLTSGRYTRKMYALSLAQIKDERLLAYIQGLALHRRYAQDIRLFSNAPLLQERYNSTWKTLYKNKARLIRERSVWSGILELLPELLILFLSFQLALSIKAGKAPIGDYVLYTGLFAQLYMLGSNLSSAGMTIFENRLKISNLKAQAQFHRSIDRGSRILNSEISTLEFCNICFKYPNTEQPALDNVSFKVERGQPLALVGLNGSGKSTIIKLLLRLYDDYTGTILLNGIDIREYELQSLRSKFSVYFQEMQNFSFSLRDNFLLSDKQLHDRYTAAEPNSAVQCKIETQIKAELDSAQAGDILAKCSLGLKQPVSRLFHPYGLELSVGQAQKLALARSLFREHSALILDEPSASLDPEAEHNILKLLTQRTTNCLTIFTSHRLLNTTLAARIVVLERGKVIECGSYEELCQQKTRFAELLSYQQSYPCFKDGRASTIQTESRHC